jgi:hypothetical protein
LIEELEIECFTFLQSLDKLKMATQSGSAKSIASKMDISLNKIRVMTSDHQTKEVAGKLMILCLTEYLAYLESTFDGVRQNEINDKIKAIRRQIRFYESMSNL